MADLIGAGFETDEELLIEPLAALGWRVSWEVWNDPEVDWRRYDAVIIRTPWDYYQDSARFLAALETIDAATRLENGIELVRWNLDKRYLRELERQGVAIVPTVWRDGLKPGELAGLIAEVPAHEVVIKPVVGASASGAYRLDAHKAKQRAEEVETYYAGRPLLAQPLVRSVVEEGEYSLFFFDGALSHAIRKVPAKGDFRSQEEHGADLILIEADDALTATGDRIMRVLDKLPLDKLSHDKLSHDKLPLYARVDLVRANDSDDFWLMELELIEPALYFRIAPGSAERFAIAADRRLKG
ncbi:MAG: hypothetical protein AAGD38_00210 [Acidobacteriota bacterium]